MHFFANLRVLLAIVAFLFCVTSSGLAQPWMDNLSAEQGKNFYDIQRSFERHWEGRDHTVKAKGWKQFKRWEWFWEQRVYPGGEFPDPMQLFNESEKYAKTKTTEQRFTGNWTPMGPYDSPGGYSGIGRINCVRTHPTNPDVIWAGSAAGGLWKSTDAGLNWATNTDKLPSLGVTDVAIHPTTPDIMYIATGDGDAGDTYSVGVLKSTDGGMTWQTTGLNWSTSQTRRISRLLMDPANPNTLIAAGSGIFKSVDAGATWTQVQGATFRDLEFKPGSPAVIYASTSGGTVHRSLNGGDTWSLLTSGLPGGGGRAALAVSPSNPDYVYALFANASTSGFAGVYRSTNSGDTWTVRSTSPNLLGWSISGSDNGGQGWYDLAIAASPLNAEEVYVGGVNNWRSTNGGSSWSIISMWYSAGGIPTVHADQHDLYFVPGTTTMYAGNDGGVYRTETGGATWEWLGSGLHVTQFYRLGTSVTQPGYVIGGTQDNGTKASYDGSWEDVLGGDGMECLIDYSDASIMYGSLYYGDIYRSNNGGLSFTQINGGISETGAWVTPYVIDPVNPQVLYAGFANVWKTTNRGNSWSRVGTLGGSTASLLAVAPSNPQVLYVGKGSSLSRTTDGGASAWTALTTPPGAGAITYMAIHPDDPNTIWVTSSGYSNGNKVYKSVNGGASWTNISGSLPNVPVNCVTYQNYTPERIYVGTDIGVFYRDLTTNDWVEYTTGLPNVIVNELEIHYQTGKIRAATYGRGIWESDVVEDVGALFGSSPTSVPFGRLETGSTSTPVEIALNGFGTDTLVITGISVSHSSLTLLDVPSLPLSLAPLQSATFRIRFSPTVHGNISDTILIISNALNGPIHRIPVTGKGVEIGRAAAGILYATSGQPVSSLHAINPASGAPTVIGAMGVSEIQALTVHPVTKELFGLTTTSSRTTLYRISSPHGDALLQREFPIGNMRAFAFAPDNALFGGTLSGRLYRLDMTTGDTLFVGSSTGIAYASLNFHPTTGELWASVRPVIVNRDKIYKVNTTTGETVLIGGTGDNAITPSIAFDHLGKLFGLKGSSTQINTIIAIDTATAAGTLVGSTGQNGLIAMTARNDSTVTSVGGETPAVPEDFALHQNYPNPFNPSTNLSFTVPRSVFVTLKVYNILGQEVRTLVNGVMDARTHRIEFDAAGLPGGVYVYRLQATGYTENRKMLLLR